MTAGGEREATESGRTAGAPTTPGNGDALTTPGVGDALTLAGDDDVQVAAPVEHIPRVALTPEQRDFLARERVGRLATVDEHGRPHAVPVCFAELDGLLYTPIDEKPKSGDPRSLRRIRNLLANPSVCLVVDHYEEDWTRLAWLQVRATAALDDNPDERARAIAALRDRYPQYRAMDLEALPLIRLTPTRLVDWSWTPAMTWPSPGQHQEYPIDADVS